MLFVIHSGRVITQIYIYIHYVCACVCVCVCVQSTLRRSYRTSQGLNEGNKVIYSCVHTHTHTHTHGNMVLFSSLYFCKLKVSILLSAFWD